MKLSDLHYELPKKFIAQAPLAERDASRLLLLERQGGGIEDWTFRDLPILLHGDELIVVNNAKVFPARLIGRRKGARAETPGGRSRTRKEFLQTPIEILLTRQLSADIWEALVRPGRKMRAGERVIFGDGELDAEVIGRGEYGLRKLRLRSEDVVLNVIERLGHVPLPPYIDRPDEPADRERYQTIFARQAGAVAAPTAGLHFTPAILERLRERGIEICELTLQVGLGTFQPIRSENLETHRMHAEEYEIPAATGQMINQARQHGRPILAVGTTVVRALEDAAQKGLAQQGGAGGSRAEILLTPGKATAEIFIFPGFRFRVVDQMLTNFHLPRSSLLAMVAAFAGRERILSAYRHAIREGYRFYSYGDCMLVR